MIEMLLAQGADIHAVAGEHGLALNAAIEHGQKSGFAALQYLLERGANINLSTPQKTFPLQAATWKVRSLEAVKICLAAGADLGMRDDTDSTVIEIAATCGYLEIFEMLWERGGGTFLNPAFPWKLTPGVDGFSLYLASLSNYFEIAQKILEKDGEKIFTDSSFHKMMYYTFRVCAFKGFYKFIQQMLVYSGTESELYVVALQEAAVKGNEKTVAALLDSRKEGGVPASPLVLAAAKGNRKVVDRLLESREDPAALDEHGWSAVLAASASKQHEILEMFDRLGKTLENSTSAPLEPSSWQISTNMIDFFEIPSPLLELDGGSAFSLPGRCF
jgi:ankyrin repeat protein